MKYAIAPLLLAAVAVIQALGRHVYHQDSIVVTGELFFPIFLAGVGVFYGRRSRQGAYGTVKLGIGVLAVVAAVLTAMGWGMVLFWFYPSIWVYYAAFLLLVVNAVIAVLSTPSAKETRTRDGSEGEPDTDARSAGADDSPESAGQGRQRTKVSARATSEVTDDGWRTTRRR